MWTPKTRSWAMLEARKWDVIEDLRTMTVLEAAAKWGVRASLLAQVVESWEVDGDIASIVRERRIRHAISALVPGERYVFQRGYATSVLTYLGTFEAKQTLFMFEIPGGALESFLEIQLTESLADIPDHGYVRTPTHQNPNRTSKKVSERTMAAIRRLDNIMHGREPKKENRHAFTVKKTA
jgi:hypothetical protein